MRAYFDGLFARSFLFDFNLFAIQSSRKPILDRIIELHTVVKASSVLVMNPPTPNLYASRCTPATHEQPPHMPALAQPRTHLSGPAGMTPIPPHPMSRREDRSTHRLSLPASS